MQATIAHAGHAAAIYALSPGTDGGLLSGGGDGTIMAWHPGKADEVRLVARLPSPVYSVHAYGNGLLFAGTAAGELFVLDRATNTALQRMKAHERGIFSIAPLDGEHLACAGGDGMLSIWRTHPMHAPVRCERIRNIPLCDTKLRALALSPGGDLLAVACGDGAVRVLGTEGFNEVGTCDGHAGGANTVAFHPAKPVLVSGGKDGGIHLWDAMNGYREVMRVAAHRSTVYQLAFDPTGRCCASASRDRTVKLWNTGSFDPIARLDARQGGHSHSVNALCWIGRDLFTGGDDRKLRYWPGAGGNEREG